MALARAPREGGREGGRDERRRKGGGREGGRDERRRKGGRREGGREGRTGWGDASSCLGRGEVLPEDGVVQVAAAVEAEGLREGGREGGREGEVVVGMGTD